MSPCGSKAHTTLFSICATTATKKAGNYYLPNNPSSDFTDFKTQKINKKDESAQISFSLKKILQADSSSGCSCPSLLSNILRAECQEEKKGFRAQSSAAYSQARLCFAKHSLHGWDLKLVIWWRTGGVWMRQLLKAGKTELIWLFELKNLRQMLCNNLVIGEESI